MTKSLRNWLASLFVLAAPGAAFGQNYLGQPYLAPVALEARCRVADGMLDSWPNYHGIGADPLRLAMLPGDKLAEASEPNPFDADFVPQVADNDVANVPISATTIDAAVVHQRKTRTSFQLGADFCPLADFASPVHNSELESAVAIETSAAEPNVTAAAVYEIAACEPVDVYGCCEGFSACPYAAEFMAEDFSTEQTTLKEITDEKIAAVEFAAEEELVMQVEQQNSTNRPSGCSPVIFSLQEEYLPYDLNPADLKRRSPIKISLLNLPAPNYCRIPADLLIDRETSAIIAEVNVVDNPDNDWKSANEMDLAEYLPAEQQAEFLTDMASPELARLPLDCWMDELLWQLSDLVGPGGYAAQYLDVQLAGKAVADLSALSLEQVVEYAKPIVPVIAQPSKHQPAPQKIAAPPLRINNELALAGSALIEIAQELEGLASALRSWGTSIHQVAAGQPDLLR